MKTPRLVTATVLSGIAVTLAACGAGSSSHVVARVTSTTSVPVTSTTTAVSSTVAGPAGSAPASGTPTTTPPTNALSTQTLDQVAADLGALDNNLNTANSDLSHPQGDS